MTRSSSLALTKSILVRMRVSHLGPLSEKHKLIEARCHSGTLVPASRAESVRQHMQWMKQYQKSSANGAHIVNSLPDNLSRQDIRSQRSCGSYYSFATTGAVVACARVQTQSQKQPQFSPQDVMSCGGVGSTLDTSVWNQRSVRGFAFLVLHYAQQYGFNSEKCFRSKTDANLPCSAVWEGKCVKFLAGIPCFFTSANYNLPVERKQKPDSITNFIHPQRAQSGQS